MADERGEETAGIAGSGLRLDPKQQTVSLGGRQVRLTGTEFRLLECLQRQPGRAFSREELMQTCIGGGAIVLDRTIDQHICSLRRKLGTGWIRTVRRVGYRFQQASPASGEPRT